jgi:hypothetical protein
VLSCERIQTITAAIITTERISGQAHKAGKSAMRRPSSDNPGRGGTARRGRGGLLKVRGGMAGNQVPAVYDDEAISRKAIPQRTRC